MQLFYTNDDELNDLKNIYDNINVYIVVFDKQYNFLFGNTRINKEFKNPNHNINVFHNFLSYCQIDKEYSNIEELFKLIYEDKIKSIAFIGIFHNLYYKPSLSLIKDKYLVLSFIRFNKDEEIKLLNNKLTTNVLIDKLIDNYPLPIFYKDKYGIYINCNDKFVEFFDKENKSEIIGKTVYDFETSNELASIYEQRDSNFLKMGENNINHIETYEFVYSFEKSSGTAYIYKSLFLNDENEIQGLVGVVVDTTQQKKLEKKLKLNNFELSLALQKDHLTKIQNKLSFDLKIVEKINYYKRYKDKGSFILMILDIDHFKIINDTYGHKIGDEILKIITKKISLLIRQTDMFFRIGGDEFALIIDGISLEDSKLLAIKLLNTIQNNKITLIDNKNITLSIGIAEFNNQLNLSIEENVKKFFEITDNALYKAKNNGRNQYQLVKKYK